MSSRPVVGDALGLTGGNRAGSIMRYDACRRRSRAQAGVLAARRRQPFVRPVHSQGSVLCSVPLACRSWSIIFVIALIIFGPRKLPELGKLARPEHQRVQARVERAAEHARGRDPRRGAARRRRTRARRRPRGRGPCAAACPCSRRSTRPRADAVSRYHRAPAHQPVMALDARFKGPTQPAPGRRSRRRRLEDPTRTPAGRCRFWSISTSSGDGSSSRSSPSPSAS